MKTSIMNLVKQLKIRNPFTTVLLVILSCASLIVQNQAAYGEPESAQKAAGTSKTDRPAIAGIIFDTPIPIDNYYFAKRVHGTFQTEDEIKLSPEEKEKSIFENLIYSYMANLKKIEVTEEELGQWIDSVLAALNVNIKRKENPAEYEKWIQDTLKSDKTLFENQMRYMAQIEKFKRETVKEMKVTVSDEEMKQEYLNIQNHVGGEYTLFETKEEAQAFYEKNKTEKAWKKLKKKNPELIKPFSLITVQAIIDLWGVPEAQINAFHAMPVGQVGEPLPFGRKWGVFRLLDKRTGDLKEFEGKRDEYSKRVESRKQYEAHKIWIKDLITQANLKILVTPDGLSAVNESR